MIGKTISHYKITENIGEALLRLSFVGQGGPVRLSILRSFSEGGNTFLFTLKEKL